jgi:hypothetical protein
MKKMYKKMLAGMLAACTVMTAALPAFAYDTDRDARANAIISGLFEASEQTVTLSQAYPYYVWHDADWTAQDTTTETPELLVGGVTFSTTMPTQITATTEVDENKWQYYVFQDDAVTGILTLSLYNGSYAGTYSPLSDVSAAALQPILENGTPLAVGAYYEGNANTGLSVVYDGATFTAYYTTVFQKDILTCENVILTDGVIVDLQAVNPTPLDVETETAGTNVATTITANTETRRGDLNGDGVVDLIDAVSLQKVLCGLIQVTDAQIATADLNEDGNLTDVDAEAMMRILLCYDD